MLMYQEVLEKLPPTKHLLLGNGFSMACDPVFSYSNLYERAKIGGLSREAVMVFELIGSNNFEGVLRQLDSTISMLDIYGGGAQVGIVRARLGRDLRSIKTALVESISKSHLANPGAISRAKRDACVGFLKDYTNIFTTNYDLLPYWVTREAEEASGVQFQDGFRSDEEDPENNQLVFSERIGRNRGLLFLHGALHLFVERGETRKYSWRRTGKSLKELVTSGISQGRYPLFVAEGDPRKKLAQIHGNNYLSYCLGRFEGIEKSLVVLGHSLSVSDQHVVDAIVGAPKLERVYVGLLGSPAKPGNTLIRRAADEMIRRRRKLREKEPRFFELRVEYFSSESAKPWG